MATGLKILSQRQHLERVSFDLFFANVGSNGNSGFSFPCSEGGALAPLETAGQASLDECRAHPDRFEAPVIQRYVNRYTEPAVGLCSCGSKVYLDDPMDNDCACGRCYNMSGQEVRANYGRAEALADGERWDEDD